jgi:beta-glucanase (GH16 family)
MKASLSRHTHLSVHIALGLTMGLLGCGRATSGGGSLDASATNAARGSGGAGGATSGSGGTTSGTGGVTPGTGGATSGSGGATSHTGGQTTGAGGGAAGTGGAGAGTGGRTSGTGGNSPGTGGGTSDGGLSATGGTTGADAAPAKDGGTDAQQPKDAALDAVPAQGDAPAVDTAPANPGDSGVNVPDGYKLVWSDEFDVDGTPNAKNWNYEKGFQRNNELQWYQSNNATVKGGMLIIEGRKERVTNPNYSASGSDWKTTRQYAEYTSTSMTTSGLQSWQYGRFEMRARIPTTSGMWPAWWTLGVSGEWPSNGEIDIMEFYKGNVLANVACGTATRWSAKWDGSSKAISSFGAGWSSNFHIWRMDWDDQNINLYLDDTLLNGVPLSSMLNSDGTSPFRQKVYMLVNLAIGGDNGGDPAGTTFPVQYEVDYVRVFQKL